MKEPFRVETGLDRTEVFIRKPPVLRHHQPIFVLSLGALVAGVVWHPVLIGVAVVGVGIGALVAFRAPAEHHLVVLGPGGFEVDGAAFDTGSLSLILTDEKIVLRDEERQAELWHGIPRLSERMALRSLLEGALDDARRRHGQGRAHVPEELQRR